MYSIKATWLGLIVLSILASDDRKLYAGSTYSWTGIGQANVLIVNETIGGVPVIQGLPVCSASVQIGYDPSSMGGGSTFGDTTTFQNPLSFNLNIFSSPGFTNSLALSLVITAPPPGGGLDSMTFESETLDYNPGYAYVQILAPNGTLSTSSQLPETLDAFENYAAGSYEFSEANGPGYPNYIGSSYGVLGAVPEPSTIVSLTIGLALPFGLAVRRRQRRRRVAGASARSRG